MGASPPRCSTVTGEFTCGAKGAGLSSTGGDLPTPAAKPRFPAEKKLPATFATKRIRHNTTQHISQSWQRRGRLVVAHRARLKRQKKRIPE
ncbi:hypothetical protein IG631_16753 [Alternaria alternata]|nr:hypothetical protein IG631_16753 [Alternaria alternata]